MVVSIGSRLLRFLSSIVIRLRQSFGRIVVALRARFISLWRSILTLACRSTSRSPVRSHASGVPAVQNSPVGEGAHISGLTKVEKEEIETLAALPVSCPACWPDKLAKYQYQYPTSSDQFTFGPQPAIPERGSQRYNPKLRVVSASGILSRIPAGQRELLHALPPLPDGWRQHIHPEGNRFFYHEELRIFTESDVARSAKEILFNATTLIQQAIQQGGVILDEFTEIVLNVDDNQCWYYYFVDHKHRLLFWLQPVEVQDGLQTDLQQITEYSHINPVLVCFFRCFQYVVYNMESRTHCEYYPHNRILPKGTVEQLRGMLNFAKTDLMTSYTSTSLFVQDDVAVILDLVNSLKDDEISNPYTICVISRLMGIFTENRFMNFYGEPCARLDADIRLFAQRNWNRNIIFKITSVLLFWSPSEHAARLRQVWVDDRISPPRWKDFISRFRTELTQYTIFSTVMLAVNVSFLAVPGVLLPQGSPASPTQIIIYCSLISAIGSIVFSLILSKVYSNPKLVDSGPAMNVLWALSRRNWGMPLFAIVHGLPNTCIMGSIVFFSVALGVQIFGSKELPTLIPLSIECLVLIFFGIMTHRVVSSFNIEGDTDGMDTSAED